MRYMKGAFQDIKKRPVLLIFIMIIGAVICFAEQFNSLTQEFGSLNKLFSTDYVTLISEVAGFIQSKATDPGLMTVSVVIAIVAAIALAAVCGVLFSGFAYTNYITVLDRVHGNIRQGKKTSQIFVEGINKRFGKMTAFFIFFILGAVAVAGLSAFSVMPSALAVKNVIAGDTGAIFSMILMLAVTVIILFFAIVFFAMYVSFLMPSIIAFKKGSVKVALRMVNGYCWYLIPRTVGFLAYMIVVSFVMLAFNFGGASTVGALTVFLANWLLKSIGLFVYTQYVFSTYIAMKDDMFEE